MIYNNGKYKVRIICCKIFLEIIILRGLFLFFLMVILYILSFFKMFLFKIDVNCKKLLLIWSMIEKNIGFFGLYFVMDSLEMFLF